jgi:hypothetical protein
VRRLQRRVHDLEAEVQRLQAQNDLLVENVDGAHIALEDLPAPEPVLA